MRHTAWINPGRNSGSILNQFVAHTLITQIIDRTMPDTTHIQCVGAGLLGQVDSDSNSVTVF